MKEEMPENVRVLRFFGSDDALRTEALQRLTAEGKVTYQEMRRGSEVLAALQCSDRNSTKVLDRCQKKLEEACSPALYATNDVTLAQALVDVMRTCDRLFVAADAETGALLAGRLEKQPGAQAVFDFGRQSYANPKFAEKIEQGGDLGAVSGGNEVVAAQGRVKEAFRLSGADFAIACLPADGDNCLILLGSKKGFWQRLVGRAENPALWMMDMLRRAALDKPQASGTSWLTYGALAPKQAETDENTLRPAFDYLPPRAAAGPKPTAMPDDVQPAGGRHKPMAAENSSLQTAAAQSSEVNGAGETDMPTAADLPPYGEKATAPYAAAPKKHSGAKTLLAGLAAAAVIAAAAAGTVWMLSGGNPTAFWEGKFESSSNLSGASLL